MAVRNDFAAGEVLLAGDINDTFAAKANLTDLNRRNFIINGGMNVWQRGTSFPTDGYTSDRWFSYRETGASGKTVTRQTSFSQGIMNGIRVQRDSGNTDTAGMFLVSALASEDSVAMQGQIVTFSIFARSGANFSSSGSNLSMTIGVGTGTDEAPNASWTGQQNFTEAKTISGTLTRYSITATIPTNSTQVRVFVSYTPVGTAGANDFFEVAQAQLEIGSQPTVFESKTFNQDLLECERFYQLLSHWSGFGEGTTSFSCIFNLHQPLVKAPVITAVSGSTLTWRTSGGSDGSATGWSIVAPSTDSRTGIWVLITGLSGNTDGHPYQNRYNNPNAILDVSAEL